MTIWNDQEWWARDDFDRDAAAARFVAAGLPFLYWLNRTPLFSEDVDREKVQELCYADAPTVAQADASETVVSEPEPEPEKETVAPEPQPPRRRRRSVQQ